MVFKELINKFNYSYFIRKKRFWQYKNARFTGIFRTLI